MASDEQYGGVPRDYSEGAPDARPPVPGDEGYMGAQPEAGDERYLSGEPVGGGEPDVGSTYSDTTGGRPGGASYVGTEYGATTGVAAGERYRASGYDETRPDYNPGEEGRRSEFAESWSEEPDASAVAAEGFGAAWSTAESDVVTTERAAEFGERWAVGPDDSPERSEEFGAAWSGDNQPDTEPERDV